MELAGKTALITGATTGIGEAIAERLAAEVATLIVHGPQPETEQAWFLEHLRDQGSARVEYLQADFARLADVAGLAKQVRQHAEHVDLLVNNAVAAPTANRVITVDGYERAWQVDYLAMVALITGLHDVIRERIINIASETHRSAVLDFDDLQFERGYSPFGAYQRAKLAIVTFTQWLAPRILAGGPAAIAICPGLTDTPLLHAMFPGTAGQPVSRAAANVMAGVADVRRAVAYMHDGRAGSPSQTATDHEVQRRLIEVTGAMLGERLEGSFSGVDLDCPDGRS